MPHRLLAGSLVGVCRAEGDSKHHTTLARSRSCCENKRRVQRHLSWAGGLKQLYRQTHPSLHRFAKRKRYFTTPESRNRRPLKHILNSSVTLKRAEPCIVYFSSQKRLCRTWSTQQWDETHSHTSTEAQKSTPPRLSRTKKKKQQKEASSTASKLLGDDGPPEAQLKPEGALRSQRLVVRVEPATLERLQVPCHPHAGEQRGEHPGR